MFLYIYLFMPPIPSPPCEGLTYHIASGVESTGVVVVVVVVGTHVLTFYG